MSLESADNPRRRLLDDPTVIRAFAHPIRLRLQAVIGQDGPLTAAEAARRIGISQALASHHLRIMAKYEFVEPAPGKDNRERPWRLTSTSTSWRGADATPEGAAAADVLEQLLAEQALEKLVDWQQRRPDEPEQWRAHTGIGQSSVYLTADELRELDEAIEALIQRYVDERPLDAKDTRPAGSRLVDLTHIVTVLSGPVPEPAPGAETEEES